MTIRILPSGSQWYFTIVASNNKVLATSERYVNKSDANHAAQLIKSQAMFATVVG